MIRSEAVFVPRHRFSRLALAIWLAQHAVAATAIAVTSLPIYVKFFGGLLVIGASIRARPRCSARLGVSGDALWTLPDESLSDLRILPGSRFTQWWVLLRLGRSDGLRRSLRIWRDTLAPEDWRQLSIRLRELRRRVR